MKELFRYLDAAGDGTGPNDFVEDYSTRPIEASITRRNTEVIEISRMIVTVIGPSGFRADGYANGPELVNGITLAIEDKDNNTVVDITAGLPIKTNFEWGAMCYDSTVKAWGLSDQELLLARFTFTRAFGGEPLKLNSNQRHRLVVRLQDDFSGLRAHRFMVQGRKLLPPDV